MFLLLEHSRTHISPLPIRSPPNALQTFCDGLHTLHPVGPEVAKNNASTKNLSRLKAQRKYSGDVPLQRIPVFADALHDFKVFKTGTKANSL